MKLKKKIKGGALQFVLFIGAVIAILLLTFITLAYSHRFFQKRGNLILQAVAQANNGINYLLHNDIEVHDSVPLTFTDTENGRHITAYKSYWGVFEKIAVHSQFHNQEFTKIALAGSNPGKKDRYSLFLQENNRPLVVVGDTKLQGKLILPKDGVRPGNMGGKSFTGVLSSPADIKTSSEQLPKLSAPIIDRMKLWLEGNFEEKNKLITVDYPLLHKNSFKNPTQLIYSDGPLQLTSGELIGNIIVYSSSKITIEKSTIAKDIVFIAPIIEIEAGFKGTLQAIASKEIQVNNNVVLEYPSALILYNRNMVYPKATIHIGNNSTIKGTVLYWDDDHKEEQFFNSQIKIEETASIEGEVYCSRGVELLGEVRGGITTSYFIVNKFGSVYQNHIYNGKLDINKLPEEYVGLIYDANQKKVAKWLY